MNDALLAFIQQRSVIDAVRQVVREKLSTPRSQLCQTQARAVAASSAVKPFRADSFRPTPSGCLSCQTCVPEQRDARFGPFAVTQMQIHSWLEFAGRFGWLLLAQLQYHY